MWYYTTMSEVSGSDVEPSEQADKPSLEGPAKPPLPKPKDEEYGFTLRNITMLAISGVFASSRAIRDGAKWTGHKINKHPALRNTLLVVGLLAGSVILSKSCSTDSENSFSKTTIEAPDWPDDCKGVVTDRLKPDYTVWVQVSEIPGITPQQIGPVVSIIDQETDAISGPNGDNYPPDVEFRHPAAC